MQPLSKLLYEHEFWLISPSIWPIHNESTMIGTIAREIIFPNYHSLWDYSLEDVIKTITAKRKKTLRLYSKKIIQYDWNSVWVAESISYSLLSLPWESIIDYYTPKMVVCERASFSLSYCFHLCKHSSALCACLKPKIFSRGTRGSNYSRFIMWA